jgi:hypothetical protein
MMLNKVIIERGLKTKTSGAEKEKQESLTKQEINERHPQTWCRESL